MEVQDKKMREQSSATELENNYYEIVNKINELIKERDYQLKIDGEESEMIYLKPNFNDLSQNARKNLAKRLYFIDKKFTRRTMNIFFLIAFKLGVTDKKVYIDLGKKEKDIIKSRKVWTIMRDKAEQALLEYKKEKGDFYKKNLV